MTVVEVPSGTHAAQTWMGGGFLPGRGFLVGGRFRLDERISLDEQVSGPRGSRREAGGLSLWKATDELLRRAVTIYLLPPGAPVPGHVVEAVQGAAKVSDPRLATIYDTDYSAECPYIVSEWAPGTHLEDLVLSGRPSPALAAAMIADAADALAAAHRAGRPHLCLTPRSLRWDNNSGLKITGLGIDAALCGADPDGSRCAIGRALTDPMCHRPIGGADVRAADRAADVRAADVRALARMLYAL